MSATVLVSDEELHILGLSDEEVVEACREAAAAAQEKGADFLPETLLEMEAAAIEANRELSVESFRSNFNEEELRLLVDLYKKIPDLQSRTEARKSELKARFTLRFMQLATTLFQAERARTSKK